MIWKIFFFKQKKYICYALHDSNSPTPNTRFYIGSSCSNQSLSRQNSFNKIRSDSGDGIDNSDKTSSIATRQMNNKEDDSNHLTVSNLNNENQLKRDYFGSMVSINDEIRTDVSSK